MTNLDMDVLRTFVLGIELGSFAKAADRVGRSQSAVSTQLRRLEDQVGAPLVCKQGRRLTTTEAGEGLLSYARRILDLNDEAVEAVRGTSAAGSIRLGLTQDFADAWLAKALARFAKAAPNVRVDVKVERTSVLAEAIARGQLDVALTWGDGVAGSERVAEFQMVWISRANDVHAKLGVTVPIVAFEQPCVFRSAGVAALDEAGISWRVSFTSPSLSGLWAAVEAGMGVTPRTLVGLPLSIAAADSRTNLPALPKLALSLHRSRDAHGPAADRLTRILTEHVQEAAAT